MKKSFVYRDVCSYWGLSYQDVTGLKTEYFPYDYSGKGKQFNDINAITFCPQTLEVRTTTHVLITDAGQKIDVVCAKVAHTILYDTIQFILKCHLYINQN